MTNKEIGFEEAVIQGEEVSQKFADWLANNPRFGDDTRPINYMDRDIVDSEPSKEHASPASAEPVQKDIMVRRIPGILNVMTVDAENHRGDTSDQIWQLFRSACKQLQANKGQHGWSAETSPTAKPAPRGTIDVISDKLNDI